MLNEQRCSAEYQISAYTTSSPATNRARRFGVAEGTCHVTSRSSGRSFTSGYHEIITSGHNAYWNRPPKLVSFEISRNAAANSRSGISIARVNRAVFLDRSPNTKGRANGPAKRTRFPRDSQNESQCSSPLPFL